jgi:hypothetical protein
MKILHKDGEPALARAKCYNSETELKRYRRPHVLDMDELRRVSRVSFNFNSPMDGSD